MPLSWHKECLENRRRTLLDKLEEVRRVNEQADRMRREIIAYDAQIIEAETRGLDGFDPDKFGKKRRKEAK